MLPLQGKRAVQPSPVSNDRRGDDCALCLHKRAQFARTRL